MKMKLKLNCSSQFHRISNSLAIHQSNEKVSTFIDYRGHALKPTMYYHEINCCDMISVCFEPFNSLPHPRKTWIWTVYSTECMNYNNESWAWACASIFASENVRSETNFPTMPTFVAISLQYAVLISYAENAIIFGVVEWLVKEHCYNMHKHTLHSHHNLNLLSK